MCRVLQTLLSGSANFKLHSHTPSHRAKELDLLDVTLGLWIVELQSHTFFHRTIALGCYVFS